jgi:hypothetical protein
LSERWPDDLEEEVTLLAGSLLGSLNSRQFQQSIHGSPGGRVFAKEHIGPGLTASNQGSNILDRFRRTGIHASRMLNGD